MTISRSARLFAAAAANILLPVSVLIFALGFFPYKPLLPGLAIFNDAQINAGQDGAIFDRLVFIVVDALRSDFVYGHNSGFEFTQGLIRDGAAVPFTAYAAPPTVTMPRIKALTTGSVPSFADLIFNLDEGGSGSSLATQDTWLAQIKAKGGKLVFYGDDTWLRLFPAELFERADGTSSFFVSDFTEVDNNVTRHVPTELKHDDWNVMIMHYLGLDHIGHKTGPQGPNMIPKQKEMDSIVRQVFEAMETKPHHANTLLVLAGDHGMNAGGNHGGSGPGETEPALLFASPKFRSIANERRRRYECPTGPKEGTEFHYYTKIQQSDLVPTLAGLMHFPVPKNSLGLFIDELRGLWPETRRVTNLLYQNGEQMKQIVDAKFGKEAFDARVADHTKALRSQDSKSTDEEDDLALQWAKIEAAMATPSGPGEESTVKVLQDFLNTSQELLSNVASTYNIPKMVGGICIAAVGLVLALLSLPSLTPSLAGVFFTLLNLLYGVMMFASSYVEEEQHFWYWLTPAWVAILAVSKLRPAQSRSARSSVCLAALLILVAHRFAVRWNQTGQKHAGEPDIVHSFFPDNHIFMWLLILATYGYVGVQIMMVSLADIVSKEIAALVAASLVLPAVGFKLNFTQADAPELVQGLAERIREMSESVSLVRQGQLTLTLNGLIALAVAGLAIMLASNTSLSAKNGPSVRITLPERLHFLLTIFLMTQSRAPNIPLFLGLEVQRICLRILLDRSTSTLRNSAISTLELAVSVLLLSHVYFFCMGGSNSISSVDLSNAYNGVADYNIVAVGILLFAGNWTGPIWWCSAAVVLTFSKRAAPAPAASSSSEAKNARRAWIDTEREKLKQDAKDGVHVAWRGPDPGAEHWSVYVSSITAYIATSLIAIMATCTVLRTHLFIWTVFSPKYLYAMAWGVGWHFLINIGFGGALRYLGQIA